MEIADQDDIAALIALASANCLPSRDRVKSKMRPEGKLVPWLRRSASQGLLPEVGGSVASEQALERCSGGGPMKCGGADRRRDRELQWSACVRANSSFGHQEGGAYERWIRSARGNFRGTSNQITKYVWNFLEVRGLVQEVVKKRSSSLWLGATH